MKIGFRFHFFFISFRSASKNLSHLVDLSLFTISSLVNKIE
ncbi:hypothetical protein OIU78_007587, partial [Salix suchowensis]